MVEPMGVEKQMKASELFKEAKITPETRMLCRSFQG